MTVILPEPSILEISLKAYVYSSGAQPVAPYLFLAQKSDPQPSHPTGKTWTFWKEVDLSKNLIGVDPVAVQTGIANAGYYIQ